MKQVVSWRSIFLGGVAVCTLFQPCIRAQVSPDRLLIWEEIVQGKDENALRWPVGVAAAASDELAVADAYDSRVLVFVRKGRDWTHKQTIQLPAAPIALAHDGKRYAVSLRGKAGLVAVEGDPLQLRPVVLPGGAVPGAVTGIAGGGFYVFDLKSNYVLRLGPDGSSTGRVEVDGVASALEATPAGGFYMAIPDRSEVVLYGANGAELERWALPADPPVPAWPSGLAAVPGGDLIVVDRHGGRLDVINSGGRLEGIGSRRGWVAGLLRFPAGVTLMPDGRVAVADQGNGRVQIFSRVPEDNSP